MQMNPLRLLFLVICCSQMAQAPAQFNTKTLEFPEYGFRIPFFEAATRTLSEAGTIRECLEYRFADSTKGKLFATLKVYPRAGCMLADSFYSSMARYTRHHPQQPFRILTSSGNTYPFGWTGYFATAAIDGTGTSFLATREVQGFTNGQVLFTVDIISQEYNFSKEVFPILEDPGYNSILLPHNLDKLNLRVFTRGNVASQYEPSQKSYYLGRCDRLGTPYPYATFALLDGEPATSSLLLMSQTRQRSGVSNLSLDQLPPEGRFSRFSGPVYQVSYTEKAEGAEGMFTHYLFTFHGSHYEVFLAVPFGPNDDHLYGYQKNEITTETARIFDERLREILGTVEKIR